MESALSGYGTVLDRDTVRLRVCQFDLRVLIHRRINRKRLTMVLADADMHHARCATVFVFSSVCLLTVGHAVECDVSLFHRCIESL